MSEQDSRPPGPRRFTYSEAQALLPEVRRLTAAAHAKAEELQVALTGPDATRVRQELERTLQEWVDDVRALGAEVKGPWLVDFDSGSGYYCWRFPETALEFYHSYEEGFAGRVRLH